MLVVFVILSASAEIVLGKVKQMFLFKCTVILALLSGVESHHCLFRCDENGLVPTQLNPSLYEGYSYESLLTGCGDRTHCSDCTSGTGHKLYNSIDELVPVERCYSICFSNVTPSVESGSGKRGLFKTNVFAEDPCSSSIKEALVCYSACLFTLQMNDVVGEVVRPDRYNLSSNATCTDFCTVPGGICDRALPPGVPVNCMDDCRTHLCPSSCQNIQNNFNLTTGSGSDFAFGGPGLGVELDLGFAEDVTLRKNGVMKIFATYTEPHPPTPHPRLPFTLSPLPTLSPSKAYGLIWRVSRLNEQGRVLQTQYIPQHLPLFLLPQEVGPFYRAGSNLFAIRELQCEKHWLQYALVNDQGVGRFTNVTESGAQCFYGSWFPRPPKKFSADLRFQQSTGELVAQFNGDELNLDRQYVEEYRVQVLSGYNRGQSSCRDLGLFTFLRDEPFQMENNSLVVHIETTEDVKRLFPNVLEECNIGYIYFVMVYATTPNSTSCSEYPLGEVYAMIAKFPDYKYITFGAFKETIVRDHVSGKADVSIEVNITSHWTSIAVLKLLAGIMRVKDQPVEDIRRVKVPATVVPTKTNYVLSFPQLKPHTKEEEYSFTPEYHYRYPSLINFPTARSHPVYVPSLRPGPVQNMTVTATKEQGGTLSLNVSWMGPLRPEGKVLSYFIRVGSPRAMTLNDETVTVEGEAQTDMSITQESYILIDLLDDEHFNVSVQAISEYGEEGAFEVVQIDNVFIDASPVKSDSGPAWYLYIIIGVIFVVFIVFLVILGVSIYYYYKRNKVVILKNTGIFINGERDPEAGEDEDDVFQPVQIDSWEISPDYIIMDCMLGEGQFGEVYKGMIKGIVNNPYFQTSNVSFVAVKILRPEASASLKSDFLKEITTMKKITEGKCPNVVNMVGCCTLQEPLALVQEYVPHGDLLTYLRTVRKLNNVDYYPVTSPTEGGRAKGNEYVNHTTSPSTPMTPMTPASTCPLLINKDPSPPTSEQIPSPYEKPYSSLGELKPVHLISFAHQIASGMKFLSDLGIVHRDLACRNVLVGENKTLKISDFGLARENDIYIKTTDGKLPLRWMAIESIVDRVFTTKSDVWSFGIVLWEITTLGGHPYPSVGNKALLAQLLRGYRMEKPENCSSELYDIMMNCWQAEASERPNFAELQGTLDVLLTNAQSENYIDLNVDEMLPYYSMSGVQEESEELDLDLKSKNDGYPDTSGLNRSYLQDIQRPDSNSSDASISSTDVQKSSDVTMPGDNTVRKMQDCTNTDCETQQNRETLHKEEKEEWPTLTSSGPDDSPEPQ